MAKSNAERQAVWRAKRRAELDRLREETKAAPDPDAEQLRAELAQQREIVRSTLAELARVEDERDRLRLELARLKRSSEPEPTKPKRRQK